MSRPKQSNEQHQEMKERIMDAVLFLLEKTEPDAISIRMIAEQVGVSHMVFYTYFHNRDALIQELIKRQQERFQARLEELFKKVKQDGTDIKSLTREALETYVKTSKNQPRLFKLFWLTSKHDKKKPFKPLELFDTYISRLGEFLKIGIDQEQFISRDPKVAALTVMSMMNAPLFMYETGRIQNQNTRDQVFEQSIEAVMHYLTCENQTKMKVNYGSEKAKSSRN
jgi:AcrR family transcriptional regulator